jgi:hypothetical protein
MRFLEELPNTTADPRWEMSMRKASGTEIGTRGSALLDWIPRKLIH